MKAYDIIQYESPSDVFVWKHPCENISSNAQLIVHESQEAVLFLDGQALDLFGPGRHALDVQNAPRLSRLAGALFGGEGRECVHGEVYFVNKAVAMDMFWGTNAPIQYQDPELFNVILPVRANGQFALQVRDGRKLLVKLVGTMPALSREELTRYFKGEFMMRIKTVFSQVMHQNNISIVWINRYLMTMASIIQEEMAPYFEEYGLVLKRFQINSVTVPEDDPSYEKVRQALAEAAFRKAQGYTYHDERRFAIAHEAVSNEGLSATLANASLGVSLGKGVTGLIGADVGEMIGGILLKAQSTEGGATCAKCGKRLQADDNFCSHCGAPVNGGEA